MAWSRAFGVFAALLAGCGDSNDGGDSSTSTTAPLATSSPTTTTDDAPTTSAGTTEASDTPEWDECTQISLEPPEVEQVSAVGIIPQAIGGEIADGTYLLTNYEVFGAAGLTSDKISSVFTFASPGYQLRTVGSTANGTFSTLDTDLTLTAECGCSRALDSCDMTVQAPTARPYTSSEGVLLIFSEYINGGTALATYMKQ